MVPKMWSGILPEEFVAPEPALPVQFHDIWHRTRATSPERALALAVLEQAVADLHKHRFATRRQRQRLYMEAYEWVASDETSWPFAFVNLCETLRLSAESLRAQLLGDGVFGGPPEVEEAA